MKKALPILGLAGLASAHCPLCSAAVGAAAVTAGVMGVDAGVIGVFVGAFGYITGEVIGKKIKQMIPLQGMALGVASFLLTVLPVLAIVPSGDIAVPMQFFGEPGSMLNKVYIVNKLFVGGVLGMLASILGSLAHARIKAVVGKSFFPFQGVAVVIGFLAIAGATMHWFLK